MQKAPWFGKGQFTSASFLPVKGLVEHQVTAVDAAELWFVGVRVTVSDTELAWLYNLITNLAAGPIQDAITREVAAQVSSRTVVM